ncbi:MAG: outer membrane lipoprotein carrier protein LolA [Bacteroidales bacterium]|nr:outer membrane lipoprotein carrier protein LolA [Bacteroidales bacterium]
MKKLFLWICLLPAASAYSQKDQAAVPYLDKISKDLDSGHALEINFDYIRKDLQDESTLNGTGTLVLMDEKYKIDLGDAVIWFDGKNQYSLQTEIEEVYISMPDPDDKEFMFADPIRLLRNYDAKFKYRMIGETTFEGIHSKEIQLFPEELGGPYALIKLFFSIDKSDLKAILIRHKKGILYTMIVTKMEHQEDPGDDFFRFDSSQYPNVDIIELMN